MELKEVYEIWDRFDRSQADEMILDLNGMHFSLKKSTSESLVAGSKESRTIASTSEDFAKKVPSAGMKGSDELNQTQQRNLNPNANEDQKFSYVTSPLVGTFYAAASPEAEAFVKVGDLIKAGDVICIIEAMKLMNEVKATKDGIIREILASDGSFVEYGQKLFAIE